VNAQFPMNEGAQDEKELRAELVAYCRLDAQAVGKIFELMQNSDLRFSDAAVQLGLVSHGDLEAAMARTQANQAPRESGLIETAIRRISSDRRIVLKHGRNRRTEFPLDSRARRGQPAQRKIARVANGAAVAQ